jgi:hypothetical protein
VAKGGVHVFTIPKTIELYFHPREKGMHALWLSLSTPDFRTAIERGLDECGRLGAKTWIVDLTREPGVPTQADLRWLENDTAPITQRNGIAGLVNIHGASAIAKMGSRRWTKSASDNGMAVYDCASLDDALALAAEIANGKG